MSTFLIPDFKGFRGYRGAFPITGYMQTDGYSCGYAAAVTLLNYFNLPIGGKRRLWNELEPCPENGITTGRLLGALRRRGLVMAKKKVGKRALRAAFVASTPVLVCARLDFQTYPEEHWMVAAGLRQDDVLLLNQGFPLPREWWPVRKLIRRASEPVGWVPRLA